MMHGQPSIKTTLHVQVPMYFYPHFPHLLSDMSKIKHVPFLCPTPYKDSEPPSSYSWTLLLSDYHLEGPRGGKGWGQWCYKNNVRKSNKLMYTRAVRKVSSHFEYLQNRSCALDVTWQPVR